MPWRTSFRKCQLIEGPCPISVLLQCHLRSGETEEIDIKCHVVKEEELPLTATVPLMHDSFFLGNRECESTLYSVSNTYDDVHDSFFVEVLRHRHAVRGSRPDLNILVNVPTTLQENRSGCTVSKMPDALGRPSNLTGFPPIYLDILPSSASSTGFQAAAAATRTNNRGEDAKYVHARTWAECQPFANPSSSISKRLHTVFPYRFSSFPFLHVNQHRWRPIIIIRYSPYS